VTNCSGCKLELPYRDGVTDASLKGLKALIAKSPNPVLVNFESAKGEDTKAYGLSFSEAARQWCPQMTFVKINIDKEAGAAELYKVWSTPQTVLFRNENEISRKSGPLSLSDLTSWVRGVLASF
jgi:thioredoxin 1